MKKFPRNNKSYDASKDNWLFEAFADKTPAFVERHACKPSCISKGKIGMGMNDPNENLRIINVGIGESEPSAVFYGNVGTVLATIISDKIGIGVVCPSAALDVSGGQPFSEEEEEKFIEELKALHYDLERCKDIETRKNLVEAFATDEFKRIYFMRGCKNKQLDFFIRTWDLQNSDSEYEAFLEEYFN